MDEVNKAGINFSKTNFLGTERQNQDVSSNKAPEKPQLTDFSDNKAEALGRSMLLKGANDNVNNDLKALLENPQIAENSDKVFEAAYNVVKAQGTENPYEVAATASTGAV